MSQQYDLIIVGSGLVGASLAIALSGKGLHIALVDAKRVSVDTLPGYDDRAIALSEGSHRILSALGVWSGIAPAATAIKEIHVSERGGFGFTHLRAKDEGVDALGFVLAARQIGAALLQALDACSDVEMIAPVAVSGLKDKGDEVVLQLEQDQREWEISARLVVAADGGNSFIRESLGMKTRRWEYGQHAVIANVSTRQQHHGKAFERFTQEGPIALLPLTDNRCALVWTVDEARYQQVMDWSDEDFLAALQERFGWRLGRFERVGKRMGYPLTHIRATESVRPRVAVIGNAAHTLHPIAGQGFNLGIRDVAALAEVVSNAQAEGADFGSALTLQQYQHWRQRDQRGVAMATDGLARLFSNPLLPVRLARNLGLLAMDLLPGARHQLARTAMGLHGRQPRLARGLPLD